MIVKNHPYVESYYVIELPNGVINLIINCNQKEIYYHDFNDNEYLITGTEDEYENYDSKCILKIDTFLDRTKAFMYIRSHMKEKDQINFYFIPYQKEWFQKHKNIIE
jgi:hypothetical protein